MYSTKEKIDFIQKVFGRCVVASDGINVAVQCPSCGQGNPSKKKFSIRIDTDVCHCWICGLKSRSLIPILKKFFPRSYLEEYHSKFKSEKLLTNPEEKEVEVVKLPDNFKPLVQSINALDPDIRSVIRYVKQRGLSYRDMWYYKLGTCTSGRFRRRVIVPSFDFEGELNFYVARSIDPDETRRYINAKVSRTDIVFNELNIDWNRELTLVEGPFDLMKCNDNATCLLGSSLPELSVLFNRIISNKTDVLLSMDPDMKQKSQKIAESLSRYDVNVRIADIGAHEDVGAMSKNEFESVRRSAKNWSSNDKLMDLIGSIVSSSSISI